MPPINDEILRQKRALAELPDDYTFPLFNARHALESQRRSGYRSTASAAREIVDNAVEAGASRIDVVLHSLKPSQGRRTVKAIAFIDDGPGMLPEMARYALSWGGGTHFEDHAFIGRFGFGLPNASINQTRRVEVYTRVTAEDPWSRVFLDINSVSSFGLQTVAEPDTAALPRFVSEHLRRSRWELGTGTVVVWDEPDRLSYKSVASLKEHLVEDFGTTYRYLLRTDPESSNGVILTVEGVQVQPVDPLFLLPAARFYVPAAENGATVVADHELVVLYVPDPDDGEGHVRKLTESGQLDEPLPPGGQIGVIRVRIVRFPVGFAVDKARGKGDTTDANRRHDIRKRNHGMSFVRANREITSLTSYPRSPQDIANGLGRWPDLQAYTYHIGVEVKFDPVLDDVFGITNDKQGVRPMEDFWRLLAQEHVDEEIARERLWQVSVRREVRREKAQPAEDGTATAGEVAARVADSALGRRPDIPERHTEEVERELESQAQHLVGAGAADIAEARRILLNRSRRRPYRVTYVSSEFGPFYMPRYNAHQIEVQVNKQHPFYRVLYSDLLATAGAERARHGLDLLLMTLARAELICDDDEMELWYKTQRERVWSPWLGTSLDALERQGATEIELETTDEPGESTEE